MVESVRRLLELCGEDHDREGLQETTKRFLAAFEFWTSGYQTDPMSLLKMFSDGGEGYDAMVFQGAIPFWSLCEHHLAPFFGVAHIGYLPNGRIVGLSKLPRVVEVLARRLQCQERLTKQIADTLHVGLNARGVGVVLRARHSCIESRGVQKAGSMTYTSTLLGSLRDDTDARSEFLRFVERADTTETNR